ncbi:MAG: DNA damage-inducible protein D [Patescibacteria group bacterium]
MTNKEMVSQGPFKDFETIKSVDENGVEFWMARQLMELLNYAQWSNFEEVIAKAAKSSIASGQNVDNHFVRSEKMVKIGSNTVRSVVDWKLDRYACYLIAQNADSNKENVALAQTYFAVQTRKQEILENLSDDEKRLFIRGEVTGENKKLAQVAKEAGVSKFGLFNDAGYRGLYGMSKADIETRKQIKKGELSDRAGNTELAANLFRITQTSEKLKKDRIHVERDAIQTHFMIGGKVRQTIKDIGGILPEELPPEKHIKEVKKDVSKLQKQQLKIIQNSKSKSQNKASN